jgi:hypothetical protein
VTSWLSVTSPGRVRPGTPEVSGAPSGAHPRTMTSVPSARQPGDMTVPLLFGWEGVAAVVTLVLVVGAVAFLLMATGRGTSGRSEWQAFLDGRSVAPEDPATGPAPDRPERWAAGRR